MSDYMYDGVTCFVAPERGSGWVPVFRAFNGSDHFYTSGESEYQALPDNYAREGIAFYVRNKPASGFVPLHRLYQPTVDNHLYLASRATPAALTGRGWTYESIVGYVSPKPDTGLVALHRAYHAGIKNHFYTTSTSELERATSGTESMDTGFRAQTHGFRFGNAFDFKRALELFSIDIMHVRLRGLCGGMSGYARDRFISGRPMTKQTTLPDEGTKLFNDIFKAQLDSLGAPTYWVAARFYAWQQLPKKVQLHHRMLGLHSIGHETKQEWPKLKRELDKRRPATLGLIRTHGPTKSPGVHHQVLATGYTWNRKSKDLRVYIYDPNHPNDSHHLILRLSGTLLSLRDSTHAAEQRSKRRETRGFFVIGA